MRREQAKHSSNVVVPIANSAQALLYVSWAVHKHSISRGTSTVRTHWNISPPTLRGLPHQRKQNKNNECAGSPSQTEICAFVLCAVCASCSLKKPEPQTVSAQRLAADRLHSLSTIEAVKKKAVRIETVWGVGRKKTRSEWITFWLDMWNFGHNDPFKSSHV